jgi:uncharacterized membrane protein YdbT with pleckstrin-like domain
MYTTLDLKQRFPRPWRFIVRENLHWLIVISILIIGITFLYHSAWAATNLPDALMLGLAKLKGKTAIVLVLTILFARLTYSFVDLYSMQYQLRGSRIYIRRGVFRKEESLLPLVQMTEVYVRKSLLDRLMGLANLYIASPVGKSVIGEIRGLTARDAEWLAVLVTQAIDRLTNNSKLAVEVDEPADIPAKFEPLNEGETYDTRNWN